MTNNSELSEREQEILKLVATGASNKEIAHRLTISTNTVKVHLRNIFSKIGANSRTEAAMYAVHRGLLPFSSVNEIPNIEFGENGEALGDSDVRSSVNPKSRSFRLILSGLIILIGLSVFSAFMIRQITLNRAAPSTTKDLAAAESPQRWRVIAPMPTARYGFALTTYDYKIYVISGQSVSGITGEVERYNTVDNRWESVAAKPLPVRDISAAVIGGKIYLPGGRKADGTVVKTLEIYDPVLDKWESGEDLPRAVSAYSLVAFEGKLILFGGWDGEKSVSSVYEYLPEEDSWIELSPLPAPREFSGIAVSGGKIYIIGGYNGTAILANNIVFSPEKIGSGESPWAEDAPLPYGRYAMGVTNLADIIYVIGGKTADGQANGPLLFSPQSGTWQGFDPPQMKIGSDLGLTSIGNYLYTIGGQIDGIPVNQNQAYQALYSYSVPIIIR